MVIKETGKRREVRVYGDMLTTVRLLHPSFLLHVFPLHLPHNFATWNMYPGEKLYKPWMLSAELLRAESERGLPNADAECEWYCTPHAVQPRARRARQAVGGPSPSNMVQYA
jgi:hypothetical protein